ncbi:uncharacterized protein LOC119450000 isoform X2 [Dermacentor silvarum]|uniref:uncharacterized protein LOC119450000 isoform X2 n=1 Tax=Dermacentor silvarum TaxID=543639 RepID=UPI00189BD994|nr:uncharacterized protein LOC119450000 isoform X2 [Dermacentor silvarum]
MGLSQRGRHRSLPSLSSAFSFPKTSGATLVRVVGARDSPKALRICGEPKDRRFSSLCRPVCQLLRSQNMASQVHEFHVEMTCEGCSGAVQRVLGKLADQGVNKVDIDLKEQRVLVDSTLSSEQLLEVLKKAGKTCSYVGVKK